MKLDPIREIARSIKQAAGHAAGLRIAKVTAISGAKAQLDITGDAWVAVDGDVLDLAVGERVYALQQTSVVIVVGGPPSRGAAGGRHVSRSDAAPFVVGDSLLNLLVNASLTADPTLFAQPPDGYTIGDHVAPVDGTWERRPSP